MVNRSVALAVVVVLALCACATTEPGPDLAAMQARYEAWITGIPVPAGEGEKTEACRNLRVEYAKQRSISDSAREMASDRYVAMDMRMRAGRNSALIEQKMMEFGCNK